MPTRSDTSAESGGHHSREHSTPTHDHQAIYEQAPAEVDAALLEQLAGHQASGMGAAGDGDGETPVQRHARLLGDARFNQRANLQRRIRLSLQLQRTYGNSHLRQVNRLIQRQQSTDTPAPTVSPSPDAGDIVQADKQSLAGPRSERREFSIRRVGETTGIPIQRTPITGPDYEERLLTEEQTPAVAPGTAAVPGSTTAPPPPPAYTNSPYTGHAGFDMTRQADGVHINVRILFLSPPTDQDETGTILPAADPRRLGSQIPEGDARRTEIANLVGSGTGGGNPITSYWNNKFELVGRRVPVAADAGAAPQDAGVPAGVAGTSTSTTSTTSTSSSSSSTGGATTGSEIVLPLIFAATAVYDQSAEHDQRVFFHTATDEADPTRADPSRNLRPDPAAPPPPPGTPAPPVRRSVIDAANWYTNRPAGRYGYRGAGRADNFPLDAIYAHEYGHYLGIPDEYSRSNPAMHTILHDITPNQADRDRMDQELNTASTTEIIIAAMLPQLQSHLTTISTTMLASIREQRRLLATRLSTALRQGWQTQSLLDNVTQRVEGRLGAQAAVPASGTTPATAAQPEQTRARRAAREAVVFEATRNLSYFTVAQRAVNTIINEESTHAWTNGIVNDALNGAIGRVTNNHVYTIGAGVAELGAGGLPMEVEARGVAGANTQLDTQAATAARTLVGASAPGGTPPTVHPSGSLLAQISGLPAQWRTMANMFDTDTVVQAIETRVAANLSGSDFRDSVHDSVRALYRQLYDRFGQIAEGAAYSAMSGFINGQVQPLLEGQLRELIAAIQTEAAGHTTATPTGTNAATGPADPALQARAQVLQGAVQSMVTQAQTMQSIADSTPSATPGGEATPNRQYVRTTAHSAMGSQYSSTSVRPNYMDTIVSNFNTPPVGTPAGTFRRDDESEFTVRRLGGGGGAATGP